MKKLIIIEMVLCSVVVVGFIAWCTTRSPHIFAAQATVDAFVALQPTNDFDQVMQLMESGTATNKFDVNQYFQVLDALRPETGYVLDWVYWRRGSIGGLPILYARKTDAQPYVSLEHYVALSTNTSLGKAQGSLRAGESFFFGYLDKIHVKNTQEGYFQLVVVRLLGDRFHLFWHEYYEETFLVCSKQGWEALLLREMERGEPYRPLPSKFTAAARAIDFTPRVLLGDKKVEINVTTYSPFKGLDLHNFAISRQYPHKILKHTHTNLLQHGQAFQF